MFVKGIGYCIASIWVLHFAVAQETPSLDGRIVGGVKTTIATFPFMVQIWNEGKFICGGSILRQQFVVTAAHCVDGVESHTLEVVAGATTLSEKGVRRDVEKILRLGTFNAFSMDNDVAVLKLRDPFWESHIGAIQLYKGKLTPGTDITIAGWGYTSENVYVASDNLQTVDVPITEKATCAQQYKDIVPVTKNMFCASQPGYKDSCTGDSGGPAIIGKKLAGIVSYGKGCARSGFFGVYTDIQQVAAFIENSLNS